MSEQSCTSGWMWNLKFKSLRDSIRDTYNEVGNNLLFILHTVISSCKFLETKENCKGLPNTFGHNGICHSNFHIGVNLVAWMYIVGFVNHISKVNVNSKKIVGVAEQMHPESQHPWHCSSVCLGHSAFNA